MKQIHKSFLIYLCVWTIFQIILVFIYKNMEFGPDGNGYITHTLQAFNECSLYPTKNNLHDIYVQAPGLINFHLLPLYFITRSFLAIRIINVFLNLVIVLEVFYLANKFFNKRVAYISCFIYTIILSYIFAAVSMQSEVPYLFWALTGFCISLSKRWYWLLIGGVCFAVAYTIRPLVLAFTITSVIFILVYQKCRALKSIFLLGVFIIPLVVLGIYNKNRVGVSAVSSTTGGYNLLMTAFDGAAPIPNHSIYYSKNGFAHNIELGHYNVAEKDSILRRMAIKWIKQHPVKYLKLCVMRVAVMFNKDTWSVPPLLDNLDNPDYAIKSGSITKKTICQIIRMGYSLVYYIVCIAFIISLFKYRKQIISKKGLLLLIFLLGVGGTCLFPMEHRYHYPYMFVICIWAGYLVSNLKKFSEIEDKG